MQSIRQQKPIGKLHVCAMCIVHSAMCIRPSRSQERKRYPSWNEPWTNLRSNAKYYCIKTVSAKFQFDISHRARAQRKIWLNFLNFFTDGFFRRKATPRVSPHVLWADKSNAALRFPKKWKLNSPAPPEGQFILFFLFFLHFLHFQRWKLSELPTMKSLRFCS